MKTSDTPKKIAANKPRRTATAVGKISRHKTSGSTVKTPAARKLARISHRESFNVRTFCQRFHLVRPDLTRMTGYSLRSVDKWAAGEKPGPATHRRLHEMERLFEGLAGIMAAEYVGEWLKTTNPAFDRSTPLQVIERGETDRIWRMIFIVETGEPL